MPQTYDLILRGGIVINHDGKGARDIGITGGKIAALDIPKTASAGDEIDCTGLHILPGVIDSQVHFREPGNEHKEDLESGSRAAVMGGVTAVFEMPNTRPLTITADALADKVRRAENRMHCDFGFWVGATHDNADELPELERLPGAVGIKVFMGSSTGDLLVADDDGLDRILSNIRRRAAFHSEDEERLNERKGERIAGDPSSHPVWRDEETAIKATTRLLRLARKNNAKIHVLHITTADEIALLADNKDIASVEITPHHLSLDASQYASLGTLIQMNPPVRAKHHQDGLWYGIQQGVADVLGTDHAPHTAEEKAQEYPNSPSGAPGVQTFVPMMLNHVANGRLTLERFVDLTSAGPLRLFGIRGKGRIAKGYDADFTIVDLKHQREITNDWIVSRSQWTPYAGQVVTGWPIGTLIRGRKIMWEDQLLTPSGGQAVKFG